MIKVQPLGLPIASVYDMADAAAYPENLVLLGRSTSGPAFTLLRVTSKMEAEVFGEGELVDAFDLAWQAGKRAVYMMRLYDQDIEEGSGSEEEKLQALLQRAYEALENFPVHVLVPLGVTTEHTALVEQLAEFLVPGHSPTLRPCIGVIATTDLAGDDFAGRMDELLQQDIFQEPLGFRGHSIVAVASPLVIAGESVNPQAYYASLISQLSPGASPTSLHIPQAQLPWVWTEGEIEEMIVFDEDIKPLRRSPLAIIEVSDDHELGVDFAISREDRLIQRLPAGNIKAGDAIIIRYTYSDLDTLAAAGITGWRERPYRGVYVATATTLGEHPFRLQSVVRAAQYIVERLNLVAESYIGRPISGRGAQESFEEDVRAALENARKMGIIRHFDVKFEWRRAASTLLVSLGLWDEVQDISMRIPLAKEQG